MIFTHLLVMWFSAFELPLAKADSSLTVARDLTMVSQSSVCRRHFSKSCVVPESEYRVRREKAVVHSGGKPARELVRSPGSNQSSSRGNETAEASGAESR